jgi:hypothetical protein
MLGYVHFGQFFHQLIWSPRDRCYDFLNIFAEKFSERNGVLSQNKAKFWKKVDHNIGFWDKRQFFRKN